MVVGLISDTHGLLRPEVHGALSGVNLILHAGDVGDDEIIRELELIAPTRAVAGNTDPAGWLEDEIEVTAGGLRIHVSHGHELGTPTPQKLLAAYGADILVYGHTHRQLIIRDGARLVVNPGAAGHRRFDLKPTVARLTILDGFAEVELVALE